MEPGRSRRLVTAALVLAMFLAALEATAVGTALPTVVAAAGVGLVLFLWQEERAPESMLPLDLFKNPIIAAASVGGVLMGTMLFCAAAFVPMFTQGVLGGTAIDAGMTLAPMPIGWPIASTLSGWFLLRVGYRPFIVTGAVVGTAGCLLLAAAVACDRRMLPSFRL